MRTEKEIDDMIELINVDGSKAWKKIGFVPYSYTDVLDTLYWVKKSKQKGAE